MALVPGPFGAGRLSRGHAWDIPHWTTATSVWVAIIVRIESAGAQPVAFYCPPTKE